MSPDSPSVRMQEAFLARPITVVVPASISFDIEKMQGLTRDILRRTGCPGCHSGRDIRFEVERNFIVDEKLGIHTGFSEPMPG